MSTIIPAILTNDNTKLLNQLHTASAFATRVQVDFALEPFIVPSSTFSPEAVPRLIFSGILEAHIMALEPDVYLADMRRIGFDVIYFHIEATRDPYTVIRKARSMGFKVGLAINPDTDRKKLKHTLLRDIDILLYMTVIPGKQGNPFQRSVIKDIKQCRKEYPTLPIAVDGGVREDNIIALKRAGAELIAVGSGIWRADGGPQKGYRKLQALIAKH